VLIREPETIDFISQSVEQTIQVGIRLGELLKARDVICLSGNLGAGKTALTRGIAAGWDAQEPVTSPTFTLIHEHRRASDALVLYHIDCYRLEKAADAWQVGLDDLFYSDDPVVIEWPEHIQDALPAERLWITLTIVDDPRRQIVMKAIGERYQALIEDFRQKSPEL
jgi:tRNA threonylcarbamoyladenosine biosynthesis protein TsaE